MGVGAIPVMGLNRYSRQVIMFLESPESVLELAGYS